MYQVSSFSASSPLRTFLFDIGRVLLDFDFESSRGRILPADIYNPAERLNHNLARKDEFETGLISTEDYTT